MGTTRKLIVVVSTGILLLTVACVGDEPVTVTKVPDDGSSSSNSSSGGSDSSSSGAIDSGVETGGPSSSAAVVCEGKTCHSPDRCCGVGTDWIDAACKPDCDGAYFLLCDDASDCGAGEVCCYTTDGGARATASFCAASCKAPQENQLCKVDAKNECTAGSCSPLTMFSPSGLATCR